MRSIVAKRYQLLLIAVALPAGDSERCARELCRLSSYDKLRVPVVTAHIRLLSHHVDSQCSTQEAPAPPFCDHRRILCTCRRRCAGHERL
jgi:hypothetical protein